MSGLEITYKIVGLAKLQAAVAAAPGLLANRNAEALGSSVALVKTLFIDGTPRGPGHFGYHLVDRVSTDVTMGMRSLGRVSAAAPQARWREFGTKAHDISPRVASELAFGPALGMHGYFVALVHHPGAKPRHTMRKALTAAKPSIRAFFVGATLAMTESMATSGD